ncbi:IclR family transcriptional regulator [Ruminiclostridium sufflavum DSM 19573]|uniref:Glycerol operon regulatory protein n=1 Tax=Ruminiclostridium sufflavum DSM 19573 TaxID=1121337 RepID=A0A318XMW4_9FIRM|nr:IclR family transcriptional regulator [Ruminiclostridium sufflavum]PYG87963.1 IclR family transcriptional regulator [Ruminiclostridium sufflavum DSM 19573]
MNENQEVKIKSLQKAIEVLNCFVKKPKLGVTEISETLGLYKSNVHNILDTYRQMGYVEQDEETGKYSLGIGIFDLSRALGDTFAISKIAQPYMQELANITNENVYLAVPHRGEVLYLEATYPAQATHLMRTLFGERAAMYCTGIGKAMLANMPERFILDYLVQDFVRFTENTIIDKRVLREELQVTRVRGYAIDNMEHEFGVKCVALPIFDSQRQVVAAMSVSGASLKFTDSFILEVAELEKRYIQKIERRI